MSGKVKTGKKKSFREQLKKNRIFLLRVCEEISVNRISCDRIYA